MSLNEIAEVVLNENEVNFCINGEEYLLYGWEQCDGYILSLESENELVWQSVSQPKRACIDAFKRCYSELFAEKVEQ